MVTCSPPAPWLSSEPACVVVATNQVNKVIQQCDAHVGHTGCAVSFPEVAPLFPGRVKHLEAFVVVGQHARWEHATKPQNAVAVGAWLAQWSLHDWLPKFVAVVMQGRGDAVTQLAWLQAVVEALQGGLLHETETHSFHHVHGLLNTNQNQEVRLTMYLSFTLLIRHFFVLFFLLSTMLFLVSFGAACTSWTNINLDPLATTAALMSPAHTRAQLKKY